MHSFKTMIRNLFKPRRPRTIVRRRPAPLCLEVLENRLVPAAHTYTVTTVLDNDVAHPGLVSLRDAVQAANTNADPGDVINFSAGLNGKTILLKQGELPVAASVKIQGPGAGLLAVSGGKVSRIFNLQGGNASPNHVTIAGLTLENGNYQSTSNPEVDGGGAIGATDFGVNFFGPSAADGLTIQNCVFARNQTNGVGGAVEVTGGNLTIQGSTFSGNTSGQEGGAISFDDAGNAVGLQMTTSTVANNHSSGHEQGGGLCLQGGNNTISSCTFYGNVAGGEGGAIASRPTGTEIPVPTNSAQTVIQNTTIHGNTAGSDGGGIWNAASLLTLRNDTIDRNTSNGHGGGVFTTSGRTDILNTIVAGDQEFSPSTSNHLHANDINDDSGRSWLYNVEYSLIQAVAAGAINGANTQNIFNTDPNLGPLQYNGGPLPLLTQKPNLGSPVLKKGSTTLLAGLTLDERGLPRIVNGTVDIGDVEASYDFLIYRRGA